MRVKDVLPLDTAVRPPTDDSQIFVRSNWGEARFPRGDNEFSGHPHRLSFGSVQPQPRWTIQLRNLTEQRKRLRYAASIAKSMGYTLVRLQAQNEVSA